MSNERPGRWVTGSGWVARRCDLPLGTTYTLIGGQYRWEATRDDDRSARWVHDVIVLAWPDGTEPARPSSPDTRSPE